MSDLPVMPKKRLNQYRGRLDADQIARGMNAAQANARRLLTDAETLANAERYPSATALAILAIEEAGKLSILRRLSTCSDETSVNAIWKEYRSHLAKGAHSIVPALIARGARLLDDFKPAFERDAEHPALVDTTKQIAIYTDCLGDAHWSSPAHVITKEVARDFIQIAKTMIPDGDKHIHTKREIELWVEYMAPVMDKPLDRMKTALLNWHRAMASEGLTDTDSHLVERFVRGNMVTR